MSRTWILLRGLIRESRHWEQFPGQFSRHFGDDQVITVDLPGNGDKCQQRSPTRVEQMVTSLRADLSQRGLKPPFHVVSLSLGAMTAISWLHDYPAEVAAAVVINTSVSRFSPFWKRLRPENYRRILLQGLLTRDPLVRERTILDITTNLVSAEMREQIARRWVGYAQTAGVTRLNALRQLFAAARFSAPAQLPSAVPVLVLNGGGDRLVNPDCSRALARGWQLPLEVHPRAGHDLTLDDGPWAVEQIAGWVATGA